jgi:hypothetical protein
MKQSDLGKSLDSNADPDADLDLTFDPDADPDPDTSFKKMAQTNEKVLK